MLLDLDWARGGCDGLFQTCLLSDISFWYSGSKGHLEGLPTIPRPSEAITLFSPFILAEGFISEEGTLYQELKLYLLFPRACGSEVSWD